MTKNLSHLTTDLITSYGNTARNVIKACRVGNARITRYVDKRWASAVHKAGAQLSPEIRSNAVAAEQKVTGYYTRGVTLGTDGADMAVVKVVEIAGKGVSTVAANATRFDKATGLKTMQKLATAAVPAAVAATTVATRVEAKSDQLVRSIAGAKPKAARSAAKRPAARKPVAKAAPVAKAVKPAVRKAVKAVKTQVKAAKEAVVAATAE